MSYVQRVALFLLASGLTLTSCSKGDDAALAGKDSTGQAPMAIDTTEEAKVVSIDSAHVIYFRPTVGETRRYRVNVLSTVNMETQDSLLGGPSGKQSGRSQAEFVIKQTIRAINPDSTVDISFWIESAKIDQRADTSHIIYSSTNAAQKSDLRFSHFTAIIGKELKTKVSNHGDPKSITGVEEITNELMKAMPDSLRNDRVKAFRAQQVQAVVNQSIVRLMVFLPLRPIAKDSIWKESFDQNIPVTQEINFPVTISSSEQVRGFEERAGKVVAILEASTVTTPKKMVIEEGQAKASLNSFKAVNKGVTRVEDKTGQVIHRTLNDQRGYVFVLESKQQPGRYYRTTNNSMENLIVELLPN
ncbi:MAG TPA: DUF6263 family protein [Candidatus Kapabacteria bacterium]|nr:DUF6263 family protein [Candidatus Kapabacteria bacterium]